MSKSAFILITVSVILSTQTWAQKKGKYFEADNPICQLWNYQMPEIIGNGDEVLTDEEFEKMRALQDGPPLIKGLSQQIFFLIPNGSANSLMATFELPDVGFACPTYFEASYDDNFIYCQIIESCVLDLSKKEKFIAISYTFDSANNKLTLIVDGVSYLFVPWEISEVSIEDEIIEIEEEK